ncbi:hypothetical protein PAHAL_4G291300 [Panicum hallii]|uniref:Uncharacterized protein n=1 Tax=Panicum hallii TaxID=206008 RepID=A0A2T8JEA1_9POAL|nr:hypothetical protein PAHAL_4G291300 [Panicum hallii]
MDMAMGHWPREQHPTPFPKPTLFKAVRCQLAHCLAYNTTASDIEEARFIQKLSPLLQTSVFFTSSSLESKTEKPLRHSFLQWLPPPRSPSSSASRPSSSASDPSKPPPRSGPRRAPSPAPRRAPCSRPCWPPSRSLCCSSLRTCARSAERARPQLVPVHPGWTVSRTRRSRQRRRLCSPEPWWVSSPTDTSWWVSSGAWLNEQQETNSPPAGPSSCDL